MNLNPIKAIKKYLAYKDNEWIAKLYTLGFNKIKFPIIIKDGEDLDVVYKLEDFAADPDLHYHEFDTHYMNLIDSNGQLWSWKYDHINKTNLPGVIKQALTVDELRKIINDYFNNTKIEKEIKDMTEKAASCKQLIDAIADKV